MDSSVSTDAIGDPPRREQDNIIIAPEPPLNWRLNLLLEEIASSIDNSELDGIKILFTGPNGLGKKTLERCNTFTKLFNVLRERCFISRGNIVFLNKILYKLNRPDLIEKTAQHCREEEVNVVYYKEELNEEGHTLIKIHVATDIRNIDMGTLDRLRNNVARIVCAPLELVRIAAVEPGSSLLVTFLIPEMYVRILQKILDDEPELRILTAVGVDTVVVGDKSYNLRGIHGAEIVETDQQRKIMNIYEQLEQAQQDLRKTELQALEKDEELQKLQNTVKRTKQQRNNTERSNSILERKNMELLAACSLLQRMRLPSPDGKAAMLSFRQVLSEASSKKQDMNLLKRMTDANTLVVSAYIRNLNEAERKRNEAIWLERKMKESELLQKLLTGVITAKEALYTKYSRHTLNVPFGLNETTLQIINEVSGHLTDREREQLLARYYWEENDLVKTCIEKDKRLLLVGLECKDVETTQKLKDSVPFIGSLLREVNRHDLLIMFERMLSQVQQVQMQQQNAFFAETARQMQSQQQAQQAQQANTGLGQFAVNEVHQIYTNTTATLDIVKQVHNNLLKVVSTGTAPNLGSNLFWGSFRSHPKPHPMSYPFIQNYTHLFGRALRKLFTF